MARSPTVYALMRKHAEIAGEIERHKRQLAKLRFRLSQVDATLCMIAPGVDPRYIVPRQRRRGPQLFRYRQLSRLLLGALRHGSADLETLTLTVMREIGMDADNPVLRKDIRRRVRYALRDQTAAGRLAQREGPGQFLLWEINHTIHTR